MKYIIELEDDIQYLIINGRADNRCYTLVRPVAELEILNSDYINEHFGELQDEAYQAGMSDAWGVARSLVWDTSIAEYETAGVNVENWGDETCEVLRRYTAQEAAELLRKINNSGQPKLDFQSDIDRFVRNANEAITELAKRFVENMKDIQK